MGCNTVAFKEDFNRASGHTHVDFLLDVLIRARVVLCIHTDVVIVLNCGNFPGSHLKRVFGQRKQKELFFLKSGSAAAVFLLKRFLVERIKPVPYCFVQLMQRKKLLVSQGGENER